jgi:hypothetical protein
MSSIVVNGDTSGAVTLSAPTVAGTVTVTLPSASGTMAVSGGSPSFTNLAYTGTLTGGTGVVNLGSGQFYKDASGNVGIGTSSPGSKLVVQQTSDTTTGGIAITAVDGNGAVISRLNDGGLTFRNGGLERARIDSSGNLLVGTTAVPNVGLTGQFGFSVSPTEVVISKSGSDGLIIRTTAGASNNIRLYNLNNQVGSVSTTTSATSYVTSSDYRLKNTIAPMTGALAKIAALKPCTYKWNVDGAAGQGFIAHELAEVEPACVTGEKDAVDADGNPQYQGIDTSFLVATLTAAIQEQQAIITALTTRITALEAK